jgi:hypothetical protein
VLDAAHLDSSSSQGQAGVGIKLDMTLKLLIITLKQTREHLEIYKKAIENFKYSVRLAHCTHAL